MSVSHIWSLLSLLNSAILFSDDKLPLEYYAVAIKKAGAPVRIDTLSQSKVCIPGGYQPSFFSNIHINLVSAVGWVSSLAFQNSHVWQTNEPRCEKTNILHMRKQRRRSASR